MTFSYDLKIRMVNHYKNTSCTLREIAETFDITKSSLQRWCNDKYLVKCVSNKKITTNAPILTFIKRSLRHNPFQTLDILRKKIITKFDTILTRKTISNYLKTIGYTKKKITRRLHRISVKEHKLNRKNKMKQIKKIKKEDIICVDESGVNRNLYNKHGWCIKNKRLITNMSTKYKKTSQSIIMAVSNKKIIKYVIHTSTINTNLYYNFIQELVGSVRGKYILMDNASIHKSGRIKDLIEGSGNKVLYIPPYSPDFNPIEEVFAEMKAFLRKEMNPLTMNKDLTKLLSRFSKKNHNLAGYYRHAFG